MREIVAVPVILFWLVVVIVLMLASLWLWGEALSDTLASTLPATSGDQQHRIVGYISGLVTGAAIYAMVRVVALIRKQGADAQRVAHGIVSLAVLVLVPVGTMYGNGLVLVGVLAGVFMYVALSVIPLLQETPPARTGEEERA